MAPVSLTFFFPKFLARSGLVSQQESGPFKFRPIAGNNRVEGLGAPPKLSPPEGFCQNQNPKPEKRIDRVDGAGTQATQSERKW